MLANKAKGTDSARGGQSRDKEIGNSPMAGLFVSPDGFYRFDEFCRVLALPTATCRELLRSLQADESPDFIEHGRASQYLYGKHGIKHLGAIKDSLASIHASERKRLNSLRKRKKK